MQRRKKGDGSEMEGRSKGDGTEKGRRCKVWGIPQYILYDDDNDDDNYTLRIERMKKAAVLADFASTVGW